jgi:hypothetical protein
MANIAIWPGSSSFFPGNTPFGFYDNDYQFQIDADKVARFCSQRLGYPLVDIELQDLNFYTAFEQAVTTYGNELYAFTLRDNMLSVEGAPTSSNLNHALVTPNFAGIIRLSQQYASEAGTGGNITYYTGSIPLTASKQEYDLTEWAISQSITGGIEIKQVFYQAPPAVSQLYSPYGGFAGLGGVPPVGVYGWGLYGGGYNIGYLMMPVAFDMANIQAIEMSNQVRVSNYTFELVNNKLRIFPVPHEDSNRSHILFKYIKLEDRYTNSFNTGADKVTNASNANYTNPVYTQINSIGRQWIFDYTLALCKEMLGYVRGKYSTVPIPGADITLNQSDLISAATAEKTALIERLRAYFDEMSKQKLLERRSLESDFRQKELQQVPYTIYIG